MTVLDIFHQLQDAGIGHALRTSNHLVGAALQLFHITGFTLLLASVLVISLRLLGGGLKHQPASEITRSAFPLFWIGLFLAVTSGTLIFLSGAVHYYGNEYFWLKLGLLLLAVVVQLVLFRIVDDRTPFATRLAGFLSLILWFGVGIAGRTIGFV